MSRLSIFRDEELVLEHELLGRQIALGRHPDNDIVLEDRTLSRFHARLESRGIDYVVVALPNQNGVFVNGIRVDGERDLSAGDRIRLGCYVAIYDPPKAEAVGRGSRRGPRSSDEGLDADVTANFVHEISDEPDLEPEMDLDMDFEIDEESGTFTGPTGEIDDPFSSPTTAVESSGTPRFVLTYNGVEVSRHELEDGMIIGRSKASDIVISLLGLSRQHARIVVAGGEVSIKDLGSQNGTWVNNTRIEGSRTMRHGDILNFYEYSLIFLENEQANLDLPVEGFDLGMPTGTEVDSLARRPTHARNLDISQIKIAPPTKRTKVGPDLSDEHSVNSELDALGLGDGSFLGDDFDDDPSFGGTDPGVEGTDLLEANLEFDDDEFGGPDVDFDNTTFSGRPPDLQEVIDSVQAWPSAEDLLACLAAGQREALVSIEIFLDDARYTQMPLSGAVTRIGSDARCDLALPPESGIAPWHCTLMHVGASVLCYRAARSAHLEKDGAQFDAAVLEDGDEVLLGRVRIIVMQR